MRRRLISTSLVILGLTLINQLYSQVYITEFMASNASSFMEPETEKFVDWVELYNPDNENVDLSGYLFSDSEKDPAKWVIPDNTIIQAGGFLLIFPDKTNVRLHTSFGLAREGEELILSNLYGVRQDYYAYGEQKPDVSMGRDPDNLLSWLYYANPTPGAPNGTDGLQRPVKLSSFIFSVNAGFYIGAVTVGITLSANYPGIVHYTINGSLPDEDDPVFPRELVIDTTTTVRARAFANNYLPSDPVAGTFFIGEQPRLPVFSISMNPEYLWDDEIGIYVNGSDFNGTRESRNSCTPDWERPMHIEFFESNGQRAFSEEAGIQVKGRMNCEFPRKPLGVYFRTRYGNDEVNYPFFNEKIVTHFQSLVLRPGGADGMGDCYNGTMFRDGLLSTLLIDQMDVDYEAYQPAVLFVNGEYWGIHNIRERNKSDYIAGNHGVDPGNIDLLENPANGGVIKGDDLHYMNLLNLATRSGDLDDQEIAQVEQMVDMQELMNYQMAEIFVNNEDWANNNVLCWRPRTTDGKWRWVFFDVEGGFGLYDSNDYLNNMFRFTEDNYLKHASLFRKLMTNPSLRNTFVQGFAAHLNTTFSTDRVLTIIDSLYNDIAFEMPRDIARWSGQTTIGGSGCSTIESIDQWNDHVEIMRQFARLRPAIIRQQIQNQYQLQGMIQLDLQADRGSITIDGVKNAASGLYYRNVPLRMEAVPEPGYRFVGWDGLSDETVIEITLDANTRIEAVFESDGSSVLPRRVSEELVLTSKESPYLGSGDLIIQQGALLRIEPGTEIRMAKGASIYVYGTIEVRGLLDQQVKITCLDEEDGRWGALVIHHADEGSYINQLIIEKASVARLNPSLFKANLNIVDSYVPIRGLYISDAKTNPLYIKAVGARVQYADLYAYGVGDYINVAEADQVLISNCYFRGNRADDTDGVDLDAVSHAEVSNCRFGNFRGYNSDGLDIGESQNVLVLDNVFNKISDKGLSVGMGSVVVARGNIFAHCKAGIGVKDEGSFVYSDRNTFYQNEAGIHCFEKDPGRGGGSSDVVNSLFAGAAQNPGLTDEYAGISYSYSWYDRGELPGNNNYTGDPMLLAPAAGVFMLDKNSLCIDAGDSNMTPDPDGSLPDIGARYYNHNQIESLFINEVQATADRLWFELYNAGTEAVNVWDLVLHVSHLKQTAIPLGDIFKSNEMILPGQYKTFELPGKEEFPDQYQPLNLDLSQLIGDELVSINQLSCESTPNGSSYGCYPNGSYFYRYFTTPTPEAPNEADGSRKGQLFINEIMAQNDNGIENESGVKEDWIEIYNAGNQGINLAGLFLTDNFGKPAKWQIPDLDLNKTYLAPGGFMLFWADADSLAGPDHLNFKLSVSGEELGLYEFIYPDTLLVDSLHYSIQKADISYGRYPDGSDFWAEFDQPTPGASNILLRAEDETYTFSVNVFPNPASEFVNIQIKGEVDPGARIEMINLSGQIMFSMPASGMGPNSRISLSSYPAGVYYLRLQTSKSVYAEALVIE